MFKFLLIDVRNLLDQVVVVVELHPSSIQSLSCRSPRPSSILLLLLSSLEVKQRNVININHSSIDFDHNVVTNGGALTVNKIVY